MQIKQLYTKCLSQACYYIECDGEAAIIDPLRDIQQYLDLLEEHHSRLKYIFETHFHADFVSGHVDLADKTGAAIVFGPGAQPGYDATIGSDGMRFSLGSTEIELLHTPGHTLESICLLLYKNGTPFCLFTGDTLFLGDVGRPDLVQKVKKEITPQYLAAQLYHSLHNKIGPLPDEVIIYPGHGAGSACGKHMSDAKTDTLGNQRKFNYALNPALTEDQFVQLVTEGLTEPPAYFPQNVLRNLQGNEHSIDYILHHHVRAFDITQLAQKLLHEKELVLLDTRDKEDFCSSHLARSLFIGLDDQFAPWVGTLIERIDTPILLITDFGKEEEAIMRLSRVGYDNCIGYLPADVDAWEAAGLQTESIDSISARAFALLVRRSSGLQCLDVRRKNEYEQAHLQGTINIPLNYLAKNVDQLDKDKPLYVHCAAGYRSVIAISVLKRLGFNQLINIAGGFSALSHTDLEIERNTVAMIDI